MPHTTIIMLGYVHSAQRWARVRSGPKYVSTERGAGALTRDGIHSRSGFGKARGEARGNPTSHERRADSRGRRKDSMGMVVVAGGLEAPSPMAGLVLSMPGF